MEEKIKPELLIGKIDLEMSKMEFHAHFDKILQARDELFDKKLNLGIENHTNFLKLTKH